jgi:proteasome lid subunit RPN8/RPN11
VKITLKQADYSALIEHARRNLPNEACGLIAGRDDNGDRVIEKIYLLTNTDMSPEHFSIDPREHLASVKDMRALGLTPLGNWHSHPSTPSRPSAEDIKLARDSNASYLILSLAEDTPVLRGFHIEGGAVEVEEISLGT